MASESELSSEDEEKESAEEGKDSPQAKRVKVSKSRSSSTTPKSAKKLKPNQSRGSGKTFTYRGTARVRQTMITVTSICQEHLHLRTNRVMNNLHSHNTT